MRQTYLGKCHCETLQWRFQTTNPPHEWTVRSCQCSFCRAHGARCTSDPDGAVDFSISDKSALLRYQFGLNTAEFLVCRNCGVYIGAVISGPDGCFTTINLNTMTSVVSDLPEPVAISYDTEDSGGRIERRRRRWTPVTTPV